MNADRCTNPDINQRPQWPRTAPAGYRYETFAVPFTFLQVPATGQLVRGLPVQLDDDQPFLIMGIFFPQIGTTGVSGVITGNGTGLCRIWDTRGNPLSQGLVLGLGMWGNGGVGDPLVPGGFFAAGWPIEDAIYCDPGGTLTFDFQLFTNAGVAEAFALGVLEFIDFYAPVFGTGGNVYTIALLDPGAPNVPLSVAVVGGVNVQVTLATDGAGVITSTFQDVYNLFLTSPVVDGVMVCDIQGLDPLEVIGPMAQTPLAGGAASTPIDMYGVLMGVKIFEDC